MNVVIDESSKSNVPKSKEDPFSFDVSCKEIVSCNRPAYYHDEFKLQRYGEREQKGLDQQLSLHFPLIEVE